MTSPEILSAAYVLPMTHGCPILPKSGIALHDGVILAIDTTQNLLTRFPKAKHTHFAEHILMPGLVNAHCHLENAAFYQKYFSQQHIAQDFVPFLIAELEYGRQLTPEQAIPSLQENTKTQVMSGTTCIASFTRFEGAFKLISEIGVRSLLLPEIVAGKPNAAQESFEVGLALAEKYAESKNKHVRIGLGPSAPYLLSRNLLNIICQHSHDAHLPLHIHGAESFAEMEFFFDANGPMLKLFQAFGWNEPPPKHLKTPVNYLADIGFFNAPVTLVGGVHLSGHDFSLLVRHLVKVVCCPSSNKKFQHGTFPLAKLIESGIPVGLGTENAHGKNAHLWTEMQTCLEDTRTFPNAAHVLHLATMGSARALGLEKNIGSLEPDKFSDCIAVHAPQFHGDSSELRELVLTSTAAHVKYVRVGERILKTE